jgi:hypothetical protein
VVAHSSFAAADIIHRTNSVRERNGDVRGAFVPKVPIRLHAVHGAAVTAVAASQVGADHQSQSE